MFRTTLFVVVSSSIVFVLCQRGKTEHSLRFCFLVLLFPHRFTSLGQNRITVHCFAFFCDKTRLFYRALVPSACEKAALLRCDFWRTVPTSRWLFSLPALNPVANPTFCLVLLVLLFWKVFRDLPSAGLAKVRICGISLPLGLVCALHINKKLSVEDKKERLA